MAATASSVERRSARSLGRPGGPVGSRDRAGSVTANRRQYRDFTVAQRWLDDDQQRTWRAWLTVAELLPRELDAQLQRDAGISHAAYVVLAMLSESPSRSRRMSDLARRANQSQSRLSHTVARLEDRGWVRRERSTEDGRGNVAVLTDAGWDIVRSVAPGHVDAVRERDVRPAHRGADAGVRDRPRDDHGAARPRPQPARAARLRRLTRRLSGPTQRPRCR